MGIDIGGVVAGAVGGLGQAVESTAQGQIDVQNKANLAQQMSDMEVQKQKLVDQNQANLANQQRELRVGRVNTAAQGLVSTAMNDKYAVPSAAIAATSNDGTTDPAVTAQLQANLNQAKTADTNKMAGSLNTYLTAAAQTGDLPFQVAGMDDSRIASAEARATAMMFARPMAAQIMSEGRSADTLVKTTSAEKIAADRIAAQTSIANGKIAALNPIDRAALEQARSLDRDIANNRTMIGKLMDSLPMTPPGSKAAIQTQIQQLQQDTQARQAQRDQSLLKSTQAFQAYRSLQQSNPAAAPLVNTPTPGASAPGSPGAAIGSRNDVAGAVAAWQALQRQNQPQTGQ